VIRTLSEITTPAHRLGIKTIFENPSFSIPRSLGRHYTTMTTAPMAGTKQSLNTGAIAVNVRMMLRTPIENPAPLLILILVVFL
jgi:hypothetical protein